MAATSLWHIEGRLKDLISYVENPEKTVPNKEMQDFFDVFSYVKNPQKTDNGEFVSAINCLKRNSVTADDSNEKAVPEDRRVYRLARLPELQARRSNARTMPRNRLKTCEGNVGRQVPDNRCHPP